MREFMKAVTILVESSDDWLRQLIGKTAGFEADPELDARLQKRYNTPLMTKLYAGVVRTVDQIDATRDARTTFNAREADQIISELEDLLTRMLEWFEDYSVGMSVSEKEDWRRRFSKAIEGAFEETLH